MASFPFGETIMNDEVKRGMNCSLIAPPLHEIGLKSLIVRISYTRTNTSSIGFPLLNPEPGGACPQVTTKLSLTAMSRTRLGCALIASPAGFSVNASNNSTSPLAFPQTSRFPFLAMTVVCGLQAWRLTTDDRRESIDATSSPAPPITIDGSCWPFSFIAAVIFPNLSTDQRSRSIPPRLCVLIVLFETEVTVWRVGKMETTGSTDALKRTVL
mmetsp:Transcript_32120/g.78237  ORF Transcript_32120/g.78237 Transcript_32120/m.78237 type:complete len:213 (+) Transcript_32120:3046-3684(+)